MSSSIFNTGCGELSPFFGFLNGLLLTREIFAARVQEAFWKLSVEMEKYTGHSFCISAATKTAAVDVEDSLIQTLRKWKSAAYLAYAQVPREQFHQYQVQFLNFGHRLFGHGLVNTH